MKKTFQKSLLVAAVSAALGTAAFAGEIATTNLIFPFVSTGSSAYTFLTVHNGNGTIGNAGGAVHFTYAMKATTAANSTGCEHQDGNGSLTANDVMQFEMSNKINVAGTTGLNNGDTNNSFPYTGGADKQGFLILNATGAGLSADAIYGSAVVVDTTSGLRLAYSSQGLSTTAAADADFTANNVGIAGGPEVANSGIATTIGAVAGNGNHLVTWYKSPTITTSWYVVPLGLESSMSPSGAIGGITASYSMFNSAGTLGGAYDMKEAFTSGGLATSVRCTGSITRADMLQPGALANTANGGLALLGTTNAASGGAVADKSLVYVNQTTSAINGSASNFINRVNHR